MQPNTDEIKGTVDPKLFAETIKMVEEFEAYVKKHRFLKWFKVLFMNRKMRLMATILRQQMLDSHDPIVMEMVHRADITSASRKGETIDESLIHYDEAKKRIQDAVDEWEKDGGW